MIDYVVHIVSYSNLSEKRYQILHSHFNKKIFENNPVDSLP
jgi:hypothetical protein